MNADSIKIESDEDGFHLIVKLTETEWYDFNIQNVAEELYESVKREIGPWLYERDQARSEMEHAKRVGERWGAMLSSDGYDASDPKHPDYYSVHADIYDNREKI